MSKADVTAGGGTGATGLDAEIAIAWTTPLARLPYVRETILPTATWRERPPAPAGCRLVGYAVLEPPEVAGLPVGATRDRRIFVLRPGDFEGIYDGEGPPYPAEAVDPRTVEPGKRGDSPGTDREMAP